MKKKTKIPVMESRRMFILHVLILFLRTSISQAEFRTSFLVDAFVDYAAQGGRAILKCKYEPANTPVVQVEWFKDTLNTSVFLTIPGDSGFSGPVGEFVARNVTGYLANGYHAIEIPLTIHGVDEVKFICAVNRSGHFPTRAEISRLDLIVPAKNLELGYFNGTYTSVHNTSCEDNAGQLITTTSLSNPNVVNVSCRVSSKPISIITWNGDTKVFVSNVTSANGEVDLDFTASVTVVRATTVNLRFTVTSPNPNFTLGPVVTEQCLRLQYPDPNNNEKAYSTGLIVGLVFGTFGLFLFFVLVLGLVLRRMISGPFRRDWQSDFPGPFNLPDKKDAIDGSLLSRLKSSDVAKTSSRGGEEWDVSLDLDEYNPGFNQEMPDLDKERSKGTSVPIEATKHRDKEDREDNNAKASGGIMFFVLNNSCKCSREGSQVDIKMLRDMCKQSGLICNIEEDLKALKMTEKAQKWAEMTKGNDSVTGIVLVLMSHGKNCVLSGEDGQYIQIKDMVTPFTEGRLRKTPKLFVIQACRGDLQDNTKTHLLKNVGKGTEWKADEEAELSTDYVFEYPELVVAYATAPGTKAARHPETGSPFISNICNKITENIDILDILTKVNSDIEPYRQGTVHDLKNKKASSHKIMCSMSRFSYTLTQNWTIIKKRPADASAYTSLERYETESRGLVVILNLHKPANGIERTGSEDDVKNLKETFEKLNFAVEEEDMQMKTFKEALKSWQQKKKEFSCGVFILMSHKYAQEDKDAKQHTETQQDKDVQQNEDAKHDNNDDPDTYIVNHSGKPDSIGTLLDMFTASKCDFLRDKPKMFIIQATDEKSCLSPAEMQSDISPFWEKEMEQKKISQCPVGADFLIARAASPGYYQSNPQDEDQEDEEGDKHGYQKEEKQKEGAVKTKIKFGSIFIRILCEKITESTADNNVLDVLREVNKTVYQEKGKYKSDHYNVPQVTSSLRKGWFLKQRRGKVKQSSDTEFVN